MPKDANGMHPEYEALLYGAFERRVAQFPDHIAVEGLVDEESLTIQKWTYAELNAKADALAEEILMLEAALPEWQPAYKAQRSTAVFLPGSPEFYVSILGTLKAGLAYCPLPTDAPAQRLFDIIDDIKGSVVLGVGSTPFPGVDLSDDSSEVVQALRKLTWVDVNNIQAWRAELPPMEPAARHPPVEDDVAYILYTSGSTGKPKGVLISHFMACASIHTNASKLQPLPNFEALRWLQFGLPTFDMCTGEIFLVLSHGGTLCSADRQLMLSDMERMVNLFKATGMFVVPSLATLLRPKKLPTLTHLICAGEFVIKYAIDNFSHDAQQAPGILQKRMINVYGPSECAIGNTLEVPTTGSRGSISGVAHDCNSIFLVDVNITDRLVETPMGLTGELVVAGPMVGYGYLNRPVETAKAFGEHPTLGRTYRTGDKARVVYAEDGEARVEILGRFNMEQVKLNTRRVELGDIESVVAQVDAVREVVTVVLNGNFLAAYIVLAGDGTNTNEDAVIAECKAAADAGLPNWMRPAAYVVLPKIPRSFGGKADRRTLQAKALETFGASVPKSEDLVPAGVASELVVDFTSLDSILNMLQVTLRSALGERIVTIDPVLALNACGLDSLGGMKYLQALRKLDVEDLTLRDLLTGKSLTDIANIILESHKAGAANDATIDADNDEIPELEDEEELLTLPLPVKLKHFAVTTREQVCKTLDITPDDIQDILPSTGLQTRMMSNVVECREFGVNKPWVEHFPYNVPAHVDRDRLEVAIRESFNARDAWRTTLIEVDHPLAAYAQVIYREDSPHGQHPVIKTVVPVYSEKPNSLWQLTINNSQKAAEEVFGPGSLASVITWITSADNAHCTVIFSVFHPFYDGVGLEHVRRNIAETYHGLPRSGTGGPGMLTPVKQHYGSDWLETTLFWMRRLAGAPAFSIGKRANDASSRQYTTINPGVGVASEAIDCSYSLQDLQELPKERGLFSPIAVIHAAWAMALSKTLEGPNAPNGSTDIQFGGVFHGRQSPEAMDSVAMMLNALPSRVQFAADKRITHRQLCEEMFNEYAESLAFTEMPCPNIQFSRSTRRFDTGIILQAFPKQECHVDLSGLPAFSRFHDHTIPWRETNTGTPILMEMWPNPAGDDKKIIYRLSYSQLWPGYEFLTPEYIRGLIALLDDALVAILERPDEIFVPGE